LQVFNWISEGKISSEVLVVDGRIIKRIKIWRVWIRLAQVIDQWRLLWTW
jgi:hypothetical protein